MVCIYLNIYHTKIQVGTKKTSCIIPPLRVSCDHQVTSLMFRHQFWTWDLDIGFSVAFFSHGFFLGGLEKYQAIQDLTWSNTRWKNNHWFRDVHIQVLLDMCILQCFGQFFFVDSFCIFFVKCFWTNVVSMLGHSKVIFFFLDGVTRDSWPVEIRTCNYTRLFKYVAAVLQ